MNHRFRTFCLGLAGVTLLAAVSSADVLHLRTGGRLEGVIVRETASSITLDVGMGEVSLPKSSVIRVERRDSALSEYRARLRSIQQGDVDALARLAHFAGENGLRNESRLMWARVLSLEPGNVEAHLALGHVLVGGTYMDEAEANRAQGLIQFEGRWMTPAEQAFLLRQREQRIADDRRDLEARRAAREEEDRERRAEAAAERARAAAANTIGLPVWGYGALPWVGYGGGYGGGGCLRLPCGGNAPILNPRPPIPAPPPAAQAHPVQPASWR
jgi:hypothetical protein